MEMKVINLAKEDLEPNTVLYNCIGFKIQQKDIACGVYANFISIDQLLTLCCAAKHGTVDIPKVDTYIVSTFNKEAALAILLYAIATDVILDVGYLPVVLASFRN